MSRPPLVPPRWSQACDVLSYLVLAALLAYALVVLVGSPVRGMADNGDYWRVMGPAGIVHTAPLAQFQHQFVRRDFGKRHVRLDRHPSSPAIMAALARSVSFAVAGQPAHFDLRQLGLVYWLLLSTLIGVGLWWHVPPLLCAAFCWILVDPRHLLFFNSFYAESVVFLALLGATLWLIRWGGAPDALSSRRAALALATLLVLLLLGGMSKQPHCLLPVVGLLAVARGWWRTLQQQQQKPWLAVLLGVALLIVALAPAYHFGWGRGHRFPQINQFNRVFHGVVWLSPEPERVLERLDIPEQWWHLRGRGYFEQSVSQELERALSRVSPGVTLALYLRDPVAVARAASRVQRTLGNGQPLWIGNYERTPEHPTRANYAPTWRATRVSAVLFGWPPLFWALPCSIAAWLVGSEIRRRPWNGTRAALWFLLAAFVLEVVVAVLGDGVFALRRHLLAAGLSLKLLVCLCILDVVRAVANRSSSG